VGDTHLYGLLEDLVVSYLQSRYSRQGLTHFSEFIDIHLTISIVSEFVLSRLFGDIRGEAKKSYLTISLAHQTTD
jgi:hypothetical protein